MADFQATCPGCKTKYRLPERPPAGQRMQCAKCSKRFRVGSLLLSKTVRLSPSGGSSSSRKKNRRRSQVSQQPAASHSASSEPAASQHSDEFLNTLDEAMEIPNESISDEFESLDAWEELDDDWSEDSPALPGKSKGSQDYGTQPILHFDEDRDSRKRSSEPEKNPKVLIGAIVGGGIVLLVLIAFVAISLLPPDMVGIGSSKPIEVPKEFVEFQSPKIDSGIVCVYPKGWEVSSGGGKNGAPPWVLIEHENVSIRIRDSMSGTGAGTIDRVLGFGNAINQGTAPVKEVHEHQKKFVADKMRNYQEQRASPKSNPDAGLLIVEFTSKPLFGAKIRGYHATVLEGAHQLTIVCKCPDTSFDALKPAFERIIMSAAPFQLF